MSGTLYGVGVGPGDPKLMTYLAVETIEKCPVIAVPASQKDHALSYRIAKGMVKGLKEKECLALPASFDLIMVSLFYQNGGIVTGFVRHLICGCVDALIL